MKDYKELKRDDKIEVSKAPRVESLANHINDWLNQYKDDEFTGTENAMDIVMFVHDNRDKYGFLYTLTDKNEVRNSLIRAFEQGFGDLFDPDNDNEREVYNACCEYMCRLFAIKPQLYEHFKINVDYYMGKVDKPIRNEDNECNNNNS